jgi:hypothetical protein
MITSQLEQMVCNGAAQCSIGASFISPSTCPTTSMNFILHVTAAELESTRYASLAFLIRRSDYDTLNCSAPKRNQLALHACSWV